MGFFYVEITYTPWLYSLCLRERENFVFERVGEREGTSEETKEKKRERGREIQRKKEKERESESESEFVPLWRKRMHSGKI